MVIVDAVEENREGLYRRDLSGARDTRRALEIFGYPSQKTFKHIVHIINNFLVTIEYIRNANTIYGCDVPTLKGKTVRKQPKPNT